MNGSRMWFSGAAILAAFALAACDLLQVEAPGRIADEDLNAQEAFPGLAAGMSFNLSGGMDATNQDLALAAGELFHGGSYDFGDLPRGIIIPEDQNFEWAQMQQARWVAEDGIKRMQAILDPAVFARDPLVATAYLYIGFSNRMLGEVLCSTAIDGGPEEPHTVHFDRALEGFNQAIQVAQAAGLIDLVNAATGGRASIKAWMGDWAGAAQDAVQVPVGFVFEAEYTNEIANDISYETNQRFEFSVWGTEFEQRPDDPRAPWRIVFNADGSITNGANGNTPMFQQLKYPDLGSNVPLTSGTELLVLRAEERLRSNDLSGAIELMNQARDFFRMEPLDVPTDIREAWTILHVERGATTWLEMRRLWDLRRWFEAGPSSPEYHPFLEGRDTCFPISEEERRANENLTPI